MSFEEFAAIRLLIRPLMLFAAIVMTFGYFVGAPGHEARSAILWAGVVMVALWLAYELGLALARAEIRRVRMTAEETPESTAREASRRWSGEDGT